MWNLSENVLQNQESKALKTTASLAEIVQVVARAAADEAGAAEAGAAVAEGVLLSEQPRQGAREAGEAAAAPAAAAAAAVPDEEESQEESGPELAAGSGELERAAELERRAREKLARWRESEGADGW